jgi:hypothetical protein
MDGHLTGLGASEYSLKIEWVTLAMALGHWLDTIIAAGTGSAASCTCICGR